MHQAQEIAAGRTGSTEERKSEEKKQSEKTGRKGFRLAKQQA